MGGCGRGDAGFGKPCPEPGDAQISAIWVYAGNLLLAELKKPPYAFFYRTPLNHGSTALEHTLTAIAVDDTGSRSEEASRTFRITNNTFAPAVSLALNIGGRTVLAGSRLHVALAATGWPEQSGFVGDRRGQSSVRLRSLFGRRHHPI